jgi:hypothetical protein
MIEKGLIHNTLKALSERRRFRVFFCKKKLCRHPNKVTSAPRQTKLSLEAEILFTEVKTRGFVTLVFTNF